MKGPCSHVTCAYSLCYSRGFTSFESLSTHSIIAFVMVGYNGNMEYTSEGTGPYEDYTLKSTSIDSTDAKFYLRCNKTALADSEDLQAEPRGSAGIWETPWGVLSKMDRVWGKHGF